MDRAIISLGKGVFRPVCEPLLPNGNQTRHEKAIVTLSVNGELGQMSALMGGQS